MTNRILLCCVVLAVAAFPGSAQIPEKKEASLRLLLSEVQPGAMASQQYCILVFDDHHFHTEKAIRNGGKDRDRKAYGGDLSDSEWSLLDGILENDGLRKINAPTGYVPLAVQDAHFFTISIRRKKGFQNMEFMNESSRKPYDSQLKPLFGWWKSMRNKHVASEAPPDSRCVLDSSHGVFSY